jgi:hypothetical protein
LALFQPLVTAIKLFLSSSPLALRENKLECFPLKSFKSQA